MTERPYDFQPTLDDMLRDLSGRLAYPPTPDLAAAVQAEIAVRPVRPARRFRSHTFSGWQRLALAAAIVILLLAAGLLAFPDARESIARRLGLPGIDIVIVDDTPTPAPTTTGASLLLGEPVSLADAQAAAGYAVQIPAALGSPDEVYLRTLESGQMVTQLYLPREGLPVTAESGVGALLMQFPAEDRPGQLAKRIAMGAGHVTELDLGDDQAFWITGETQLVLDQDPSDTFEDLIARDSGNVLLWQADGLTFRLETALSLAEALVLAESVSPMTQPGTVSP